MGINLAVLMLLSFCVKDASAICLGCSGERVAVIQRSLAEAGLYSGDISGIYDLSVRKSVKAFQKENGLDENGEATAEAIRLLGISSESGDCFCAETELLARYLQVKCPTAAYCEMLTAADKVLEERPSLSSLIQGESGLCGKILDIEASSQAYEAACEALSNKKAALR